MTKTGCCSPFAFPACIHRDTENGQESNEREIRAVVLALPQGTVEAEALWTVHDRVRYLWPLSDGHFLLRDRNNLLEGDATLVLKPYLDFPGPLLWLDMDPAQQFLVTNSREPLAAPQKTAAPPGTGLRPQGRYPARCPGSYRARHQAQYPVPCPATTQARDCLGPVTTDQDDAATEEGRPISWCASCGATPAK